MAKRKEPFGERLRRLMENKGFNQTTFAELVGIDRTELNRTINGKRKPKPHEIEWYAEALGIDVHTLVMGTDLSEKLMDRAIKRTARESEHLHAALERAVKAEAEVSVLKGLQDDERSNWQEERKQHASDIRRRDNEIDRLREQEKRWRQESAKWQTGYYDSQQRREQAEHSNRVWQEIHRQNIASIEKLKSIVRKKNGDQFLTGAVAATFGAILGSGAFDDEDG